MPGRRITKREMKEDKLVTLALRAFDYTKENIGRLAVASAVAVFLILGTMYVIHVRRDAEEKASFIVTQGNSEYWAGRLPSAQSLFGDAASRYPGSSSGKVALLRLADTQLALKKYNEALDSYRGFLKREKKKDLLILSAKKGIAIVLEEQKTFADAAREYQGIAETVPKGETKVGLLLDAVRCFRAAGKREEAVTILKGIVSENPDLRNARQVRSLMLELEARGKTRPGGVS